MPATVVVGGQYGSEGKGKIVANLASRMVAPWIVRCGGPNSGHTATLHGGKYIFRQLPSAPDVPNATHLISAGCAIDVEILLEEIQAFGSELKERIVIDPRAVIIAEEDRLSESKAIVNIGSTCSGTGAAFSRRSLRHDVQLAGECKQLLGIVRIEPVAPLLHAQLDGGCDVIIEGTQGFGLSLLHGPYYPFVTSRDTTASGFIAEVGLSPRQIQSIVMVIRTFPIRVGGTSGPFPGEIDWAEVSRISGAPKSFPEYTSVTNRLRRVAHFDPELVRLAALYNRPTAIALMGIDRLDYKNTRATMCDQLTSNSISTTSNIENLTRCPIEFIGTGFEVADLIWRVAAS
jgi:adenylosuccinate synthase